MMANPEMVALLSSPRLQYVMQQVMEKGKAGVDPSIMRDPETRELLQKLQGILGPPSEAYCERLQTVRHPPSDLKQILAGLRNNGFAVVRGGSSNHSSGWFGAESMLDAAQAEAVSALEQLRGTYRAQLAQNLTLPRAPWLYSKAPERETTSFWYREGYSCAYANAYACACVQLCVPSAPMLAHVPPVTGTRAAV